MAKSETAKQIDITKRIVKDNQLQLARIVLAFLESERNSNEQMKQNAKNLLSFTFKQMINSAREQVLPLDSLITEKKELKTPKMTIKLKKKSNPGM